MRSITWPSATSGTRFEGLDHQGDDVESPRVDQEQGIIPIGQVDDSGPQSLGGRQAVQQAAIVVEVLAVCAIVRIPAEFAVQHLQSRLGRKDDGWEEEQKQPIALIEADCKADRRLLFIDTLPAMLGDDDRPRPGLFREDKLHLNTRGYELWNSLVKPVLK